MRHGFPEPDATYDPAWFAPLELVATMLADSRRVADSFFAVEDFMLMGWYQRTKRSRIMLYKHRDTRRYLNVDENGCTYRYVPPADPDDRESDGTYRRVRSLREAVADLELWLLPWFRDEYAHQSGGVPWDERYERFIALNDDPDELDPDECPNVDSGDGPGRAGSGAEEAELR